MNISKCHANHERTDERTKEQMNQSTCSTPAQCSAFHFAIWSTQIFNMPYMHTHTLLFDMEWDVPRQFQMQIIAYDIAEKKNTHQSTILDSIHVYVHASLLYHRPHNAQEVYSRSPALCTTFHTWHKKKTNSGFPYFQCKFAYLHHCAYIHC